MVLRNLWQMLHYSGCLDSSQEPVLGLEHPLEGGFSQSTS